MKYDIILSNRFRKDLKIVKKRGYDLGLLDEVVTVLANGENLQPQYRDHELSGEFKGFRECHVQPDWILIYRFDSDELLLFLTRTGTHSDLF